MESGKFIRENVMADTDRITLCCGHSISFVLTLSPFQQVYHYRWCDVSFLPENFSRFLSTVTGHQELHGTTSHGNFAASQDRWRDKIAILAALTLITISFENIESHRVQADDCSPRRAFHACSRLAA